MTASDQDLRAITHLALACRPHGAPRWDADGIYANLAKVRDRSVGSITIAAVQAAEDRNAVTPGVIPTSGPHWRPPEAAPIAPTRVEPSAHCTSCGKDKTTCDTRRAAQSGMDPDDPRYDDHTYLPVSHAGRYKRDPEPAHLIADSLRAELAPTREPDHGTTVTPGAGRARLEETTDAHTE